MIWNRPWGDVENKSRRNNIKGSVEAGKHKFTVVPIAWCVIISNSACIWE